MVKFDFEYEIDWCFLFQLDADWICISIWKWNFTMYFNYQEFMLKYDDAQDTDSCAKEGK